MQAQEGLGRFVDARVVSGVLGCDLAGSLKRLGLAHSGCPEFVGELFQMKGEFLLKVTLDL